MSPNVIGEITRKLVTSEPQAKLTTPWFRVGIFPCPGLSGLQYNGQL
jgi:hypothetical protein